jgi:hypothetical protein
MVREASDSQDVPLRAPFRAATYWLRGGWRCSNGAGGAVCFNARRPAFDAIEVEGLGHGLAVTAATGLLR